MRRLVLALVTLGSLTGLGVAHADEPKIPPVTVTGTVTVDGQIARSGAQIAAVHGGTTCAVASSDRGHYALKLTAAVKECWATGNVVTFAVDGRPARESLSSPASAGITLSLNLSVGQAPTPQPSYAVTGAAARPDASLSTATQSPPMDTHATVTTTTDTSDAATATDSTDTADSADVSDATETSAPVDSAQMAVPVDAYQQKINGPAAGGGSSVPPYGDYGPSPAAVATGHFAQGTGAGSMDLGSFVTDTGNVLVCYIISGVSQTGLSGPQLQFEFAPNGGATIYQSPVHTASNCDTVQIGPGHFYISVLATDWTNWTLVVDPA